MSVVVGEAGFQGLVHDGEAGGDDEFVTVERGVGGENVDGQARAAKDAVGVKDKAEVAEVSALGLGGKDPVGLIIKEEGDVAFGGDDFTEVFDFARNLSGFREGRGGDAVGAQEACVVLFLRERGLAPAEVEHGFGTVGDGFPGPEAGHAGEWCRVPGGPVYGAGLLFHDPPAALADGAIKVVVEGLVVGITLAQIGGFVGFGGL